MAVRKRTYHGYDGPLTGGRTRFLVLFRYAWKHLMRSRLATVYFIFCLLVPVVFGAIIYASHSTLLLALFGAGAQAANQIVNGNFFYIFIRIELSLALILTAFTAPSLISPDMANQALPLYFCRPLSRPEYVLGKFSVLAVMISAMTWLPGLCLFALQANLAGWAWTASHLYIAGGIFFGSFVILLVFSALALALSAWFRRRAVAGAAFLGVFFVGAGFGQALDATLRTHWGGLIDIGGMVTRVVAGLLRVEPGMNEGVRVGFSPVVAGVALLVVCALCVLLIGHRIRAREVVRQ